MCSFIYDIPLLCPDCIFKELEDLLRLSFFFEDGSPDFRYSVWPDSFPLYAVSGQYKSMCSIESSSPQAHKGDANLLILCRKLAVGNR